MIIWFELFSLAVQFIGSIDFFVARPILVQKSQKTNWIKNSIENQANKIELQVKRAWT